MIPSSTFPIFCIAGGLLILSPGPDTLYILARSIGQGRMAGVVSALGVFCGLLVHLTAATLGLSALLASSAVLFAAVKWAGAAYLIYLGCKILLSKQSDAHLSSLPVAGMRQIFRQGAVTNILNPKVALFFVSFLPQFVESKLGHIPLQIATLGTIFAISGTLGNCCTAMMAGSLGNWLRHNPRAAKLQQRFTGCVFIGLGARMALLSKG